MFVFGVPLLLSDRRYFPAAFHPTFRKYPLSASISDAAYGKRVVRGLAAEKQEIEKYNSMTQEYYVEKNKNFFLTR